jgi:polysaccharide biosynthesis transport protein
MGHEKTIKARGRYLLGLLLAKKALTLSIALIIVSIFTVVGLLMPASYESKATASLSNKYFSNRHLRDAGGEKSRREDGVKKIRSILTGRPLFERVVKRLNPEVQVKDPDGYVELVGDARNSFSVKVRSVGEQADITFIVSSRSGDPKKAMAAADAYLKESVAELADARVKEAGEVYALYIKQLQVYKGNLDEYDSLLREFRVRHPQATAQGGGTTINGMQDSETGKIDNGMRLQELQKRRDVLRKELLNETKMTNAASSGEEAPRMRLLSLNKQFAALSLKYTENHPEVIKVKKEIDELQKSAAGAPVKRRTADYPEYSTASASGRGTSRLIQEELERVDVEIESAKARRDEAIIRPSQTDGPASFQRDRKEREDLLKLQQERAVYQKSYEELLAGAESARLAKADSSDEINSMFRVVDPPGLPKAPDGPNRAAIILMGLIAGAGVAAGSVILLDYTDRSFKDEDRIARELNTPVLASIPDIVLETERAAFLRRDKVVLAMAGIYLAIIMSILAWTALHGHAGQAVVNP